MGSKPDERVDDGKSCNQTQTVTVKNLDWTCKFCSYTNNEEVSRAVFGDSDEGIKGAQLCVICYKYCAG